MLRVLILGLLSAVLGWVIGLAIGAIRGGRGAETWGGALGGFIGYLAYRWYQDFWPTVTRRAEYGRYTVVEDPYYPVSLVLILGGAILTLMVVASRLEPRRVSARGRSPSPAEATPVAASRPGDDLRGESRWRAVLGMALLGAASGLVSGWAESYVVDSDPRAPRPSFLLACLMISAPGAIYGLMISLPFAWQAPDLRALRAALVSLAGGLIYLTVYFVATVTAGMLGLGLFAAGFVGSQMFGRVATHVLDLPTGRNHLRRYVLAGTLTAVAFLPHFASVMNGPRTPFKVQSGYLGFIVWQTVTAAMLAPLLTTPRASAHDPLAVS